MRFSRWFLTCFLVFLFKKGCFTFALHGTALRSCASQFQTHTVSRQCGPSVPLHVPHCSGLSRLPRHRTEMSLRTLQSKGLTANSATAPKGKGEAKVPCKSLATHHHKSLQTSRPRLQHSILPPPPAPWGRHSCGHHTVEASQHQQGQLSCQALLS